MNELAKVNVELPDELPATFEHDGHKFEVRNDRVVRDGKEVAVLVSPGFGAGFVTWCTGVSPMDPKLVILVLTGKRDVIAQTHGDELAEWLGLAEDADLYTSGARDLVIEYVPVGTAFRIDEYDGSESLVTLDDLTYRA